MDFIKFDKTQLINLEYSLPKELVRSNRAGSFSCTTILGCNTRKYHGLLVSPEPELDGGHHVLLSKVDETVIQHDAEFNLGINRFPGSYYPKGHKYVRDFSAEMIPKITYRVGGVVLTRETMFVSGRAMVLIRYTLVEAHSPTRLRLRPFLAFRNIHSLSKKNISVDTRYTAVPNGIRVRMYEGYSPLHMQISRSTAEYIHAPDWFNDFEYTEERERGYEYTEDLYNPGYFEMPIKKGESIIFCASINEAKPATFTRIFNDELSRRTPRNSFENCLINAAQQFFFHHSGRTGLVAGYPWYGRISRYSMISLPGIALANPESGICDTVLDSLISNMQGPLFMESEQGFHLSYDSSDTALWFFRTLQLCMEMHPPKKIWQKYGQVISRILEAYIHDNPLGMSMDDNGLIFIPRDKPLLTWMNAEADGQPLTPRYGYVVEVNALWYNALRYGAYLAGEAGKKKSALNWNSLADKVSASFVRVFSNKSYRHLADFVYEEKQDMSVRPNQIMAAALPFSPLSESMKKQLLDVVYRELLTPRGLRSLSPNDPRYRGRYAGDARSRDTALHQGSVWPWLLGPFADAWLGVYGKQGENFIRGLYEGFADTMKEHGIGTLSEIHEGDPPHKADGAISFAPSVAELYRIYHMLSGDKPGEKQTIN